jgi:hypothetical protein
MFCTGRGFLEKIEKIEKKIFFFFLNFFLFLILFLNLNKFFLSPRTGHFQSRREKSPSAIGRIDVWKARRG